MTRLLYSEDPGRLEFTAKVVRLDRIEDIPVAVTDRTAFFPEGGGQPGDSGWLGDTPVTTTTYDDGEALHWLEGEPEFRPGDVIEGRVDGEVRRDHAQQHTAQHLLSALLYNAHDLDTLSFHLGRESSHIDLDASPGDLSDEFLDGVETEVNLRVMENIPVSVTLAPGDPPTRLRGKSTEEIRGELRVVEIGDALDASACCGTHTRSTGEIGPVAFLGTTTVRGRIRLFFLAGSRALDHYRRGIRDLGNIASMTGTGTGEAVERVERLLRENDALGDRSKLLEVSLARCHAQTLFPRLDESGLLRARWASEDVPGADHPRMVAAHLPADRPWILLAAVSEGDSAKITLARSPAEGEDLTGVPLSIFRCLGGRGGGTPDMIRGAMESSDFEAFADELRSHLESRTDSDG